MYLDINNLSEERFERYLSGEMTDDERQAFESQLAEHGALRNELSLHKLSVAALRRHANRESQALGEALQGMTSDELKSILQRRHHEIVGMDVAACVSADSEVRANAPIPAAANIKSEKRKKRFGFWPMMLGAAALVSGVWLGARTFYSQRFASIVDKKISETYIALENSDRHTLGAARGDNEAFIQRHESSASTVEAAQYAPALDSVEVVMQQALFAMKNGLNEDAIRLLEPLYESSGYNKDVGVALAMAYINANEREKAVNTLTAMSQRYDGDSEIEGLLKAMTN